MKPAPFKYFAPANIAQAIEMLAADDQARPIASGQSLVPMMNLRLARPSALIDLNRIPGLSDIRETGEVLCIGSMTRQATLLRSPLVRRLAPLMTDALAFVGHPPDTRTRRHRRQHRQRGSGCRAPSSDVGARCRLCRAWLDRRTRDPRKGFFPRNVRNVDPGG